MSVHDYGIDCAHCHGRGFIDDAERERMPDCPISPDYAFEPGPAGIAMAKANEVKQRRSTGTEIREARKAAGMTQAQLAHRTGASRASIAMGERSGTWGKDLLQKVRVALEARR